MVDYLIWPWFERFPVLPILYGDIAKIPEDRFPTLVTFFLDRDYSTFPSFNFLYFCRPNGFIRWRTIQVLRNIF